MTVPPSPNHALLVDHRVLDVVCGLHEPAEVVEDLLAEVREHRHGVDEARVEVVGDLVRERDRELAEDLRLVVAAALVGGVEEVQDLHRAGRVIALSEARVMAADTDSCGAGRGRHSHASRPAR